MRHSLSRRNALAVLAALPIAVPTIAEATTDPVFAAIAAHKEAHAAMRAKSAESRAIYLAACEKAGPVVTVSSRIEPGTVVAIHSQSDLEEAIPQAQHPTLFAEHLERFEARQRTISDHMTEAMGCEDDGDFAIDEYDAEQRVMQDLAETVPATLQGLFAMVLYAAEISDGDLETFEDYPALLQTFATTIKNLTGAAL